ncbi:Asp-tRNA(Asn)/Glu-tRNA(Gln) amidotransferase subunit GatC [Candidatus Nomurabacteria bacterium]|nr:Asp-tRNA(Asn)/Glu-tRNA(Gln) amidotransferase subunit GatC [Candidatus Nomurabacteria bacterium]
MKLEDIKKLAVMARVDMSDEELTEMANDFEPILAYVAQVQEVANLGDIAESHLVQNVMRDDVVTNTPGEYTEKIIKQMPDSQDGFLKVKQIL